MLISVEKWNICKSPVPVPDMPPMIKRGLNEICKLAISSFHLLGVDHDVPSVCASRFGCWQYILKLAEQFYKEGEFSPAVFSKTPLNTFAAMISIMYKNTLPYTTVSAGDKTFEMGLIEAVTQKSEETVCIYAEESSPEILKQFTNTETESVAFSMLISKNRGDCEISFVPQKNVAPKTVYDFVKFLEKEDESFVTSNFTITRT
jgi:hypothetical protein